MLQIPVCQSSLVSRTFSVHIRIWMFTLCTMHLGPGKRYLVTSTTPLHRNTFTHRRFYTQTQRFYTQALLHTDAFTHKSFYTETVLHTDASTRRYVLHTHTRFHTQTLLHTDALTHKRFYTGRFYTQMLFTHAHTLSNTNAFTHRRFYTQTLVQKRKRPSQFFLSF